MMPTHTSPQPCGQTWLASQSGLRKWIAGCAGVGAFLLANHGGIVAQEKTPTVAVSTTLIELKPAQLLFVDRHEVAFDRPGVLQFVCEEAEIITAGQVVARLEDGIAKAALAVAEARVLNNAEVISAQKQAELAKVKWDSSIKANEDGLAEFNAKAAARSASGTFPSINDPKYIPTYNKVYLDELQLGYEASLADIERFVKEHEVNLKGKVQAQAELNVLELKAPRDGLVTRAFKQTGEGVQSGEKVMEIISTKRIRVVVNVPAVTAARLKVGMPVTVIVQQPSGENAMDLERYPSVLKFIDPTTEQVSQKVRIWAEIDNSDGKLREGLVASIEIVPTASLPATKPQ